MVTVTINYFESQSIYSCGDSQMSDSLNPNKALPHSYPFLMLDRIVELMPGKSAIAIKNLTADCSFAPAGAYPQVFLVEGMAQLAAAAAAPEAPEGPAHPSPGFLAAVTDFRFHKKAISGNEIRYFVEFEAAAMGMARFRGRAEVDGEPAAEGVLTFSIPAKAVE